MTVTNCGTVAESGVVVTQVLTLADPAGTAPPPAGARGAARTGHRSHCGRVRPMRPHPPPMTVAGGHLYTLT